MKKIILSLIVLCLIGLGLFVLLKPNHTAKKTTLTGPITTRAAKDVGQIGPTSVTIQGNKFLPPQLLVKKGTKVTWTNQDAVKHGVTTDAGSPGGPNGPLLSKGQSYSYTFDTPGTYSYHSGDQSGMQGSVVVTE